MRGRYVPSLLAAIGEVIETHMIDIGFLPPPQATSRELSQEPARKVVGSGRTHVSPVPEVRLAVADPPGRLRHVTGCGIPSAVRQARRAVYRLRMDYEYDQAKSRKNLEERGIDFEFARTL